eukprot:6195156-Pleurochrysis_carterae.AAC.1
MLGTSLPVHGEQGTVERPSCSPFADSSRVWIKFGGWSAGVSPSFGNVSRTCERGTKCWMCKAASKPVATPELGPPVHVPPGRFSQLFLLYESSTDVHGHGVQPYQFMLARQALLRARGHDISTAKRNGTLCRVLTDPKPPFATGESTEDNSCDFDRAEGSGGVIQGPVGTMRKKGKDEGERVAKMRRREDCAPAAFSRKLALKRWQCRAIPLADTLNFEFARTLPQAQVRIAAALRSRQHARGGIGPGQPHRRLWQRDGNRRPRIMGAGQQQNHLPIPTPCGRAMCIHMNGALHTARSITASKAS